MEQFSPEKDNTSVLSQNDNIHNWLYSGALNFKNWLDIECLAFILYLCDTIAVKKCAWTKNQRHICTVIYSYSSTKWGLDSEQGRIWHRVEWKTSELWPKILIWHFYNTVHPLVTIHYIYSILFHSAVFKPLKHWVTSLCAVHSNDLILLSIL